MAATGKLEIAIEYCVTWNYVPQAVGLAEAIMDGFGQRFGSIKLIPSDGGRFEVSIDGNLVFSKLETGRFPENKEIIDQIRPKM